MAEEPTESPQSSSMTRLIERVQGTLRINLGELSRERRISSLQELRRRVVESKRAEYMRRLEKSLPLMEDESENADADEESATDMEVESDESDASDAEVPCDMDSSVTINNIDMKYNLVKDAGKILVWPEFLLATEKEIREEAAAIKQSLMFVRPEGQRVLIVINKFVATEYRKDGTKRRSFKVAFSKGPTMLDCVVKDYSHQKDQDVAQLQYFVLDVMVYNGCLLAPSDSECRIFFIKSRLEEASADYDRPRFSMVEYHDCTPENMMDAYYRIDQHEYDKDSIVFVDRRASYVGGYNPNWLCWRDENTSKYEKPGKNGHIPARVICDSSDKTLRTLDGIVVCKTPKKLKRLHSYVATIMVKDMDLRDISIKDYMITGEAAKHRRKPGRIYSPADSLRKIASRFLMANVADHNSEEAYQRLVSAVTGS
ncbi:DNA ligase/mRNA capping enzyme like protein [Babesia gibsoni]|uniref:Snurportin-1 n=1 Tax=Babesia gibsoni TaxID=33632 RepID=A0AAD8P945_BABGI|nr:DNA ligase/mRNA capping enzyme like protein [Babesia gibsoni]